MVLVGQWCWLVVLLACRTILAAALAVWVVLGSMGGWWALMLDCGAILASAYAVWVVLGGLGCQWVVMLDRMYLLYKLIPMNQ